MVRILYIGPIPPEVGGQAFGGIATHCWELAVQAHRHGYEVFILADTPHSFTRDEIRIVGLPPGNKVSKAFRALKLWLTERKRTHFLNFLGFKEKLGILYTAYCLRILLRQIKPDLIHIHSLHNSYSLALRLLRSSIPIIITDHGAFGGVKGSKDLIKIGLALSIASKVICVSQYTKKRLEQLIQILNLNQNIKRKLCVIVNPIDARKMPLLNREELIEKYNPERKKIIFFSGVYEPIKKKRLDLLLKAFSICNYLKDNCKLIVLTAGEGIRYSTEFISRNKINGVILKPMPLGEIIRYYALSDVFVMPSQEEALGLVYVESLLAGTPVVGHHEIIKELEDLLGVYIGEKFDASREGEGELAEKIVKVLNTEFDRELLRTKVIENLFWDVKFGEFDAIYREMVLHKLNPE